MQPISYYCHLRLHYTYRATSSHMLISFLGNHASLYLIVGKSTNTDQLRKYALSCHAVQRKCCIIKDYNNLNNLFQHVVTIPCIIICIIYFLCMRQHQLLLIHQCIFHTSTCILVIISLLLKEWDIAWAQLNWINAKYSFPRVYKRSLQKIFPNIRILSTCTFLI